MRSSVRGVLFGVARGIQRSRRLLAMDLPHFQAISLHSKELEFECGVNV
jgi:hypothetical protein